MQARAPPNSRSSPINQALPIGFHAGFLGAAGFVLLAIVAAASIGVRHAHRRHAADRGVAARCRSRTRPIPELAL